MDPIDEEGKAKEQAQNEAEERAGFDDEAARAAVIDEIALEEQNGRILGVNTRHYPAQASAIGHQGFVIAGEGYFDQSDNPPPTVVVLVQGMIGDYAAYCGHGKPEWVKAHGDKLSFEEACCHFPGGLVREKYRV